jgi:chromosome segregation ATPase
MKNAVEDRKKVETLWTNAVNGILGSVNDGSPLGSRDNSETSEFSENSLATTERNAEFAACNTLEAIAVKDDQVIKKQQQRIQKLKSILMENQITIAKLQAQLETDQIENAQLYEKWQEIETLQSELKVKDDESNRLDTEIRSLQQEITQMKRNMQTIEISIDPIRQAVAQFKAKEEEANETIRLLEQEIEALEALELQFTVNPDLIHMIEDEQAKVSELEQEVCSRDAVCLRNSETVKDLERDSQNLRLQLKNLEEETEILSRKKAKLQHELKQIAPCTEQTHHYSEKLSHLKDKYHNLKQTVKSERNRLHDLKVQEASDKSHLEKLRKHLKSAELELKSGKLALLSREEEMKMENDKVQQYYQEKIDKKKRKLAKLQKFERQAAEEIQKLQGIGGNLGELHDAIDKDLSDLSAEMSRFKRREMPNGDPPIEKRTDVVQRSPTVLNKRTKREELTERLDQMEANNNDLLELLIQNRKVQEKAQESKARHSRGFRTRVFTLGRRRDHIRY